ncbi:hypothetical protein ARSEF1564_009198 [Beauveria bassiana]
MAKRKRGADSLSLRHLEKLQEDIARALKEAKGFERQRMSKRQRAFDKDPEKKAALERDINVLKSLDLHQTARAHLYSSLLRIKSIANHEDLPAQLKKGVAKPELAEDERLVLHNVTSGLYNRDGVKKAVDKAITFVCEALDIPVPQKGAKGKRERKEKTENTQEAEPVPVKADQKTTPVDNEDETDFEGFSADDDDDEDAVPAIQDLDSDAEVAQENDISALDGLLGSSSDEDEDEDDEERARLWAKYRGKETVNLDDISLSGGDSEPDDAVDTDEDNDEPRTKAASDKKVTSRGVSLSSSPEPQRKRSKKATSATVGGQPTGSTFLPSLMGGYVSGSESASDVDVAPPKKRRGQQARRAIWAQKYGSRAKHLQDAARNKGRGRDDGWDMKRGAVDAGDSRTPWKKGVKNPFSSASGGGGGGGGGGQQQETRRPPPPPKKRDDQGPLHPSWEARKKAKESQKAAAFAGSKVVFD